MFSKNYPSLFSGLGKMKNVEVKLHIDENVKPIHQSHRRIPFHQRKNLEACVESLLQQDIIEPADRPTPWVSPVVLVPKPKQPGGVRLCVDMREANKAITCLANSISIKDNTSWSCTQSPGTSPPSPLILVCTGTSALVLV